MDKKNANIFDVIKYRGLTGEPHDLESVIYRIRPDGERFMFLMQNPGGEKLSEEERKAHKKIEATAKDEGWSEAGILEGHVECNNDFLLRWLLGKNPNSPKKFSEGFHKSFQDAFRDFGNDSDRDFWQRFYITDYVKQRARTQDLEEADFDKWQKVLEWEIKSLKNLKLILVFGTRTWENFSKKIDDTLEPVSLGAKAGASVTDAHGHLFKSSKRNYCVMPLVHMSHQPFQNALRNSYFDYLGEGLREFQKING